MGIFTLFVELILRLSCTAFVKKIFKNYSVKAEYFIINYHSFSIAENWNMVATRVSLCNAVELGLGFRFFLYYLTRDMSYIIMSQFIAQAACTSIIKWTW